jgi:hypothetical protein
MKIKTVMDRARKSGGADIMDSLMLATRGTPDWAHVLNKSILYVLSFNAFDLGRDWFSDCPSRRTAEQVFLDFAYHVACEEWPSDGNYHAANGQTIPVKKPVRKARMNYDKYRGRASWK